MGRYDALVAAWSAMPAGVTGSAFVSGDTTAQKLEKLNAWTVPGSTVDVPANQVRGVIYALGKWSAVAAKANAARANADTSEAALACQNLYDLANANETVPMTNAAVAARIKADLDAMVTASIIDSATGSAVLALSSSTIPWWQSAGYSSPISAADLAAAGGLS